ncbi:unnamed protein product [Adineta steineri]|uniref:F-box domain-containing protein n=1 Tax=Adineta steineri TaxID=433720 RepID=A0A814M7C5_9BILA|nr:unnamed protein product [Adineta steineri]CAF3644428.1 unnamed protein product [Adineta steineri]CAF3919172.1 unnamed protein product [Adineta steineri]
MSSSAKRNINEDIFPSKHKTVNLSKISIFTTLPNELIIIIFNYLKPIDILYSFSNLNSRFTYLIHKYKQNINLCNLLPNDKQHFQEILKLINKDIISLKIDQFIFDNNNLLQQFPVLKHLIISNIDSKFAKKFILLNSQFKYLETLELQTNRTDLWLNPWANGYDYKIPDDFHFPVFHKDSLIKEYLIHVRCSSLTKDKLSKFSPTFNLVKMEIYLTDDNDLFILFNYIPNIKIFKCQLDAHLKEGKSNVKLLYLEEFTLINTKFESYLLIINSFLKDCQSLKFLSLNLNSRFKDKNFKVGTYENSHIFSLPYPYSHFQPILTGISLNTTISISSDLFHNIRSINIEINRNNNNLISLLKFVQTYFKKVIDLHIIIIDDVWPPNTLNLTIDTNNLCLSNIKRFAFLGNCYDLKQLLSIFPNLNELDINHYSVWENFNDYLFKNNGDKELLQMKYLRTVGIFDDNTWQGGERCEDREFQNEFIKHCPNINLCWSWPLTDDDEEEEDDDDDEE